MKKPLLAATTLAVLVGCQSPADSARKFTREEASALVGQYVEYVGTLLPFKSIAIGDHGQSIYLRAGMQGKVVALDERPKGNFGVIVRWDLPDLKGGPWTSWISRYSSQAIRVIPAEKP